MVEEDYSAYFGIIVGVTLGFPLVIYFIRLLFSGYIVPNQTCLIVERFGKNPRRLDAGWYFLWPLVDRIRPLKWRYMEPFVERNKPSRRPIESTMFLIDLRETVMDFPTQFIITRDNVEIEIHPMLLYRIHDPIRAIYEVYDLSHAVQQLVQTTLRSVIGDMGLDDTLASREEINRSLKDSIAQICYNWGLEITCVEVLEITPSYQVQNAMHKQLAAERDRRAAIVVAQGFKDKVKFTAEGEFNAEIARSKGEQQETAILAQAQAEQRVILAKAQAQAVEIIGGECSKYNIDPVQYIIATKYIQAFQVLCAAADSRDVIFPSDVDVVGSCNTLLKN